MCLSYADHGIAAYPLLELWSDEKNPTAADALLLFQIPGHHGASRATAQVDVLLYSIPEGYH